MSTRSRTENSPWIAALELPACDQALAERVRVAPQPLTGIHEARPDTARKLLMHAIEQTYRPSAQDLRLIRRLYDMAGAHARLALSSEQQFMDGIRKLPSIYREAPMTMLTGHAGVGKSALIRAARRLVPNDLTVEPSKALPPFRISPWLHLDIKANIRAPDLLNEAMSSAGVDEVFTLGGPKEFSRGAQRLYQAGACGVLLDELQFINRSTGASTLTVKILTRLTELQLPIAYACNYSLGHKLKRRPPEDVTRLMSSPLIVLPDLAADPAFVGYLEDIKIVMDGVLKIDAEGDAAEIHNMTFGLRRLVIRLIACAYVIARELPGKPRSLPCVTMEHLKAAYLHVDFQFDRLAVEQCQNAALGFSGVAEDYLCPFELPPAEQALQKAHADQLRQRQLNDALHKASMTRDERMADQAGQAAARAIAKKEGKPVVKTKPATSRPKKPTTAAEWAAALDPT